MEVSTAETDLSTLERAIHAHDEVSAAVAIKRVLGTAEELFALKGKVTPAWFERLFGTLTGCADGWSPDDRIACLLICAQWFQKEGQVPLGVAAAEKAVAIAETTENFKLLRRCYSVLGNLHNTCKDYVQATICYARAVELARSLDDRFGECASIANLAAARLHSGLLEESRNLNALVINMASALEKSREVHPGVPAIKQQAQANVALASLLLGDLYIGRSAIEEAVIRGPQPRTLFEAYQRVLMEYTYVRILSRDGDFQTARDRAKAARGFAAMASSRPADIHASLAETACDVNEQKFDIALSRLQRLLTEAKNHEPTRRDIMDAMVQSHRKAGNFAEAGRINRTYLESLCAQQKKSTRVQLAAIKQSIQVPRSSLGESVLPPQVLAKLRDREREVWLTLRKHLEALAVLAELRDDSTGEHAFRVGRLSGIFARRAGCTDYEVETIELAARLHDLGKLIVPDVILQKRGKLIDEELEIMQRHAADGYNILMDIQHEAFLPAAEIALHHHEWWDGAGYPQKLAGETIPKAARITALVDVFDALSHKRPYKPAWPFEQCVQTIRESRGRQFDPDLCDIFVELIIELHRDHFGDLDGFLGSGAEASPLVNASRLVDRMITEHRAGTIQARP